MVGSTLTIGLLALQGGFAKHQEKLIALGVTPLEVRHPDQLDHCDGLILPGGESTTQLLLLEELKMREALLACSQKIPFFGTCAGLIIMAHLHILPIEVERNAYGRQLASFSETLDFMGKPTQGIFIRAPQIKQPLSPDVKVLATHNKMPVCVEFGRHIGATFHPELTNDPTIHHYLIQRCKKKQ